MRNLQHNSTHFMRIKILNSSHFYFSLGPSVLTYLTMIARPCLPGTNFVSGMKTVSVQPPAAV